MADTPENEPPEIDETPGIKEIPLELRELAITEDLNDPMAIAERVYLIWKSWADFHLYIISPFLELTPPKFIHPELIAGTNEYEFVYPIVDCGSRLSTSKGGDMFHAGWSMCKLFFTIEKMISILIDKLKSGGIDSETEVQIAFEGHEIALRKAFESVINLDYNVVVTNFEPGPWGEQYLKIVKTHADKGYGYPSSTPRDNYKQPFQSTSKSMK